MPHVFYHLLARLYIILIQYSVVAYTAICSTAELYGTAPPGGARNFKDQYRLHPWWAPATLIRYVREYYLFARHTLLQCGSASALSMTHFPPSKSLCAPSPLDVKGYASGSYTKSTETQTSINLFRDFDFASASMISTRLATRFIMYSSPAVFDRLFTIASVDIFFGPRHEELGKVSMSSHVVAKAVALCKKPFRRVSCKIPSGQVDAQSYLKRGTSFKRHTDSSMEYFSTAIGQVDGSDDTKPNHAPPRRSRYRRMLHVWKKRLTCTRADDEDDEEQPVGEDPTRNTTHGVTMVDNDPDDADEDGPLRMLSPGPTMSTIPSHQHPTQKFVGRRRSLVLNDDSKTAHDDSKTAHDDSKTAHDEHGSEEEPASGPMERSHSQATSDTPTTVVHRGHGTERSGSTSDNDKETQDEDAESIDGLSKYYTPHSALTLSEGNQYD